VENAVLVTKQFLEENPGYDVTDLSLPRPSPVDANGNLWCTKECEEILKEENRTVDYAPQFVEYAERNFEFAKLISTAFSNLVNGNYKFHDFPPMKLAAQREFIEILAEFYEISTEIIDPEDPECNVIARKTSASSMFVLPPSLLLRKTNFTGSPQITIISAIEFKRRGLLLFKKDDVEIRPEVDHKPRLARGFAKPIPVPQPEQVKLSNAFELLNIQE
ncbi:hypothetical protein HDU99_003153, partial [Rhizoclosmatium hyalinum]